MFLLRKKTQKRTTSFSCNSQSVKRWIDMDRERKLSSKIGREKKERKGKGEREGMVSREAKKISFPTFIYHLYLIFVVEI